MASPPPTFAQLEQAALHIIRLISDTPGLGGTKLAVIGDLALCKYLPQYDCPQSIDFVVSKSSSPGRVRKEIVGHPMSPLVEKSGTVYFRLKNGREVEVKLVPDWLCPYLPAAARPVRDDLNTLPYISLEDLLVFKADACGLRERDSSKRREAYDAAALLDFASRHSPLKLEESKMDRIEQALEEVVEYSAPEHDKSWWQRCLGRVPDKQRSAHEIFSELADHPTSPTTPTSPGAISKTSSIYSTMSRTPSSMSTMSAHSTTSSISSVQTLDDKSPQKNSRPRKMSATTGSKSSRHSRHISSTDGDLTRPLDRAMQRLDIGRSASPGVALTNRI